MSLCRRLRHSIAHCQIIIGNPQTHDDKIRGWDHTHIDDPRELLLSMLCEILFACLYGSDQPSDGHAARSPVSRAFNSHKPFRSAKGTWPTRIEQLFPFGPENTVTALVEACCTLASRCPLYVLTALLELARPRIWDILLQPENHQRISWAISSTLLLGVPGGFEQLELHPEFTPAGCSIPARWAEARWLRDGKGLQAASALLYSLRAGNYSQPDDILRFAGAYAPLLGPALTIALEHYRTTQTECDALECYYHMFQRAMAVQKLRPVFGEDALMFVIDGVPRDLAVLRIVRLAMNWLLLSRRCAGPGCARTMIDRIDDVDKPLSTCARCRLTRYCSKGCQQADWKAGAPVPHRQLCSLLSRLREIGDLDAMTEEQYVQFIEQSGLTDRQLALVGKWALSRGVYMQHHLRVAIVPADTPAPPVDNANEG
ncbi:hypothetical protein AURDEDRAFT_137213 [Auricularia subglabra TFB-10046 SS5]|nr:hypothetical protein AURDEDRAFT_137213 [Auricularia subglabra TFB-10046 SS5]